MHSRNVFAVRKYGAALGGNAQSRKFGGEVGGSGHLYAGEIVEVTVIVDVVADAKRPPPFAAAPARTCPGTLPRWGCKRCHKAGMFWWVSEEYFPPRPAISNNPRCSTRGGGPFIEAAALLVRLWSLAKTSRSAA
jgi:hypothetical protein